MRNFLYVTAAVLGLTVTMPAIAAEGQRIAASDSTVLYSAAEQANQDRLNGQLAAAEQTNQNRLSGQQYAEAGEGATHLT